MRHKKEYLTTGDWERLKDEGKTEPKAIGTLTCYFCESPVSDTNADARGLILPYCNLCGIFYQPKSLFTDGTLYISIVPRVEKDTYRDTDEIPHLQKTEAHRYTKKPQHKDVRGQIIAIFEQYHTIKTAQIQKQIHASRQSVHSVLNTLVQEGVILKKKRGTYQRVETKKSQLVN